MASGYWSPVAIASADGPAATAAAATSVLPVSSLFTFPPNSFVVGSAMRITAQGRISNVITSPGTARLDVRLGGTVIFDTGPLALNAVAKTTLPWWFDALIVCRAVGATGNFFGFGRLQSESIVGSPLASTGGSGSLISAVSGGPETAPAVGGSVNTTVSNLFDFQFTQTLTTGSFTVHNFILETGTVAMP
jgi:hypothetical protein